MASFYVRHKDSHEANIEDVQAVNDGGFEISQSSSVISWAKLEAELLELSRLNFGLQYNIQGPFCSRRLELNGAYTFPGNRHRNPNPSCASCLQFMCKPSIVERNYGRSYGSLSFCGRTGNRLKQ